MQWLLIFSPVFIIVHLCAIGISILSRYEHAVSVIIFAAWSALIELGTLVVMIVVTAVYAGDDQCAADNQFFTFCTLIGIVLLPLVYVMAGLAQDLRDPKREYRWRLLILIALAISVLTVLNMLIGLWLPLQVPDTHFNTTCTHVNGFATRRTYGFFSLNYQPPHLMFQTAMGVAVAMFTDRKLKLVFAICGGAGTLLAILINLSLSPAYVLYWSLPPACISLGCMCFSCCCAKGIRLKRQREQITSGAVSRKDE